MRVAYIVHDLADAAVSRRRQMLARGGAEVRVAGFRRAHAPVQPDPGVIELGVTHDAAMVQRAKMVARHCALAGGLAAAMRDAEVVVARSLEQLAIARRIVGARPLVYECLDIHRSLLGRRPADRAVQYVERMLLPRVDLLLTSSPAFIREYFAKRPGLRAPAVLLENKLLRIDQPAPQPAPAPPGPPWTIGWFGMLRCRRTLTELRALAEAMPATVNILIAGRPSAAEFPDFAELVAGRPNIRFLGEYKAADLPALYAQCHFAWTIDWFEEGQNSRWLLPNRVYEASAFGAVPIVLDDVEVGRWLEARGAGMRVGSAAEIAGRLGALDAASYQAMRDAVVAIPDEQLIATEADCIELVDRLRALRSR